MPLFVDRASDTLIGKYLQKQAVEHPSVKDSDVAHLFRNAVELANICLPKSFVDILKDSAEVDIYQAAVEE